MEIQSPYKVTEVLFTRKYPGYIYRREAIDDSDYGGNGMVMVNCYSDFSGKWIGNAKTARQLCKKHGIRQLQPSQKGHHVCSIGFNPKEKKWYGWSHRAIYGFGIGSTCKKGDCGYTPETPQKLFESITTPDEDGWAWQDPQDVKIVKGGVEIHHKVSDEVGVRPDGSLIFEDHGRVSIQVIETGRGEWTAKTLEDAKKMAIDFAAGVS